MLPFFSNTKLSAAIRRGGAVFFGEDVACGTVHIAAFIGLSKSPNLYLASSFEDTAAGRIEGFHAYLARHDGLLECADKAFAYYIHVYTGIEGTRGDGLRSPMPCSIISDIPVKSVTTKPLKPHCLRRTSVISHLLAVAGTVYLVEGCHYASHACLYGGFVGVHVFVEHTVAAHVYRMSRPASPAP